MLEIINDPYFRVEVINATKNPQQVIYAALHQDYSEGFVFDEREQFPSEERSGEIAVKSLLSAGRGHYGAIEHPQIIFNIGYFPHSCLQQIRTHRIGVSFDCQSLRYTGQRIANLGKLILESNQGFLIPDDIVRNHRKEIEEVFYLRPSERQYCDRQGHRYIYKEDQRNEDLWRCADAAIHYYSRISEGFSEEHARSMIPFDVRQNWVMSCNARSLMHMLDLRWKADAQLEAQTLSAMLFDHFKEWVPNIAIWYEDNRAKKARLAP